MQKNTKEKILVAALDAFSENGYKGTNLRDLAASLGLSKSALYKHFPSKEAIWDALISSIDAYYDSRAGIGKKAESIPATAEELRELSMSQILFTVEDPKIVRVRKLLTVEQFRDARVASLVTKHFLTDIEEFYREVFAGMMKNGALKRGDAAQMAFAYVSPISVLIHLCDREPEKKEEALAQIEAFVEDFLSRYAVKE